MRYQNYLEKEFFQGLRNDPQFFNFLEAASLDGIWYWDLEHAENEWMSPSFWRLFGVDPEKKEHKASEWQDIIHPADLETAMSNFNRHLEDPSFPYDQLVRYRHTDGSMITVRCRGLIIRDEFGKACRMLGAHNDVTELESVRLELSNSNHELLMQLEKSEKLSSAKTAFMSMMSHEIRTPLNAIMGLFELIASTSQETKQASRAEKGLLAAQQLYSTLSTILEASKLEVGSIKTKPKAIATSAIFERVDGVLEGVRQRYGHKADYTVEIVEGTPEALTIDEDMLLQVVTNLIDNAVKFSDGNPVRVRATPSNVEPASYFRISVEDEGPGIKREDQETIFEPFRQSESGPKRKIGGTGLGLSIVKQLVASLGGEVSLSSTFGKGTTVSIDLPIDDTSNELVAA